MVPHIIVFLIKPTLYILQMQEVEERLISRMTPKQPIYVIQAIRDAMIGEMPMIRDMQEILTVPSIKIKEDIKAAMELADKEMPKECSKTIVLVMDVLGNANQQITTS